MPPITVVQGGQFGSEAKGLVAAALCRRRNIRWAVRTGAINAGHTVYHPIDGSGEWACAKMQQLPVGWVNRDTQLVIGPGAYIHPPTLQAEVARINTIMGGDVRERIVIDYRAGLHSPEDEMEARAAGRHTLIGATGKGCAEAIVHKIKARGLPSGLLFRQHHLADEFTLADVPRMLMKAYKAGAPILIEGCQGTGLDFHQGPYPYVTSRMTTAANWVAEAGLPVTLSYKVVLVLRTYPIRVAGNSGPLAYEINWPDFVRRMNHDRADHGQEPLVGEAALLTFEDALRMSAATYNLDGRLATTQHLWSDEFRLQHQEALSKLNADALMRVKEAAPDLYEQLAQVFEFTTVTKKLRRIGRFFKEQACDSIRSEGATEVALTFANYDLPQHWFADEIDEKALDNYVREYQTKLGGCPITMVGFGPREEHLLDTEFE